MFTAIAAGERKPKCWGVKSLSAKLAFKICSFTPVEAQEWVAVQQLLQKYSGVLILS